MAPPVPLSAFDGLESEVGSQPDRTAQARAPHQTEGTATPQGTDDPPLARFITEEAVGAPAIQEFIRVFFGDSGDESSLIEPSSTLSSLSLSDRDQLFREMDLPFVAKGRLRKALAAIMKHHGMTGATSATPGVNPPPTPKVVVLPAPDTSHLVRFDTVIAQGMRGTFEPLSEDAIRKLRAHYKRVRDQDPPETSRPSDNQLSGLSAAFAPTAAGARRAPYCDFGIFGPFNETSQRLLSY